MKLNENAKVGLKLTFLIAIMGLILGIIIERPLIALALFLYSFGILVLMPQFFEDTVDSSS